MDRPQANGNHRLLSVVGEYVVSTIERPMSPRYETMVFDRAAWENPSRRVRPLWPIEQWPWTGERFDTAQESRDFHEATVDFFTRLQA